jgi:hypothetical protein
VWKDLTNQLDATGGFVFDQRNGARQRPRIAVEDT